MDVKRSLLVLSVSAISLSSCSVLTVMDGLSDLQHKNYSQGLVKFNELVKDQPTNAYAYVCRAQAFVGLRMYDNALYDCNKAVELDPNLSAAYGLRSVTNSELGKTKEALIDADKFVEMEPKMNAAYNNRACVFQALGKQSVAIDDCNRALSLQSTGEAASTAHVTRGYSYGLTGNSKAQMSDYDAAIACSDVNASAYLYRAKALDKEGKTDLAAKDRLKAKKLGYVPDPFVALQLKAK